MTDGKPTRTVKVVAVVVCVVALVVASWGLYVYLQPADTAPNGNNPNNPHNNNTNPGSNSVYESDTPIAQLLVRYAGSVLLGRPTDRSVTMNIIAPTGMAAYVDYGTASGSYPQRSGTQTSSNGDPIEIALDGLTANTKYFYRVQTKQSGGSSFKAGTEHSFTTQRPAGSSFVFDLQADPHMDQNSDAKVYNLTLQNEAGEAPDFVIDLGDTFMTEKFAKDQEQVLRRYIEQRAFFDQVGGSAPLFLASGNHDAEGGWQFSASSKDSLAYWAIDARKDYYPNPFPDSFYTGSTTQDPTVGLHENYYSWTWGDALFVVLDPYTYTMKKIGGTPGWDWTLGQQQYEWLRQTLSTSNAKYKFVFAHHVLGEGRGMTAIAGGYEWGGKNADGSSGFGQMRPGWEMPIHQLMVKNNVTAFFQGHDHMYVKEELDGIVYQEVPQPSLRGEQNINNAKEYGYTGTALPSSGHLRITVSPAKVTVDYIKTYTPDKETGGHKNGEVASSYTMT